MMKETHYDAIIIGAGMSGLAAGIRLSMFGKKVCILEKHSIAGGLNSYYRRGKILFDVGLHALTNFCERGERRKPLGRLLQQLRIPYEDLKLAPQIQSRIIFPEVTLTFTNDFQILIDDINQNFPQQGVGFLRLVEFIQKYNELDLNHPYQSAKEFVRTYISDPLCLEMIFCPLLIYGSAWENDMDLSQFVVMFKSIFLQGFSRCEGGVRTIIHSLLKRLDEEGAELCFKKEVREISGLNEKVKKVTLTSGEVITSDLVISSIGYPETLRLCPDRDEEKSQQITVGQLSFVETIVGLDLNFHDYGHHDTIIFYNNNSDNKYDYRRPNHLIDDRSAVICSPCNFQLNQDTPGILRVTMMANYNQWKQLEKNQYKEEKEKVLKKSLEIIDQALPQLKQAIHHHPIIFNDVFTPTTISRYTNHLEGAVYGSPQKTRDGKTPYPGLYICGTDQGFLGIVGAMLSGITIANLYGFYGLTD